MFLVLVRSPDGSNDGVGQVGEVAVDALARLLLVLAAGLEQDREQVRRLQALEGLYRGGGLQRLD